MSVVLPKTTAGQGEKSPPVATFCRACYGIVAVVVLIWLGVMLFTWFRY
jgi:hypothetical protein